MSESVCILVYACVIVSVFVSEYAFDLVSN